MSWSRAVVGLGLGALLARSVSDPPVRPRPDRPVALWAADRGGDRVIGLDQDGFALRSLEVRAPVAVAPGPGGGAWIGTCEGPHAGRVLGIDPDGSPHTDRRLGPVLALEALPSGAAVVLERSAGAAVRAWCLARGAPPRRLAELEGLERVRCDWGVVLLATRLGELVVLDEQGERLAHGVLAGTVVDLAPGPRPWTWWALRRGTDGGAFLALLDATLSPAPEVRAPAAACLLGSRAGLARPWVFEASVRRAHRLGHSRRIERMPDLPLGDVRVATALADGGVLVAVPGAVLALDGEGRGLPGQGGFDYLVDIALVAPFGGIRPRAGR